MYARGAQCVAYLSFSFARFFNLVWSLFVLCDAVRLKCLRAVFTVDDQSNFFHKQGFIFLEVPNENIINF